MVSNHHRVKTNELEKILNEAVRIVLSNSKPVSINDVTET